MQVIRGIIMIIDVYHDHNNDDDHGDNDVDDHDNDEDYDSHAANDQKGKLCGQNV